MQERVKRLLEGQRLESAPLVSTFYSLCVRVLRRDARHEQFRAIRKLIR